MQPTKKKKNNKNRAQNAIWWGLGLSLLALLVIPLPGKWLTYSTETGVVGDTIGGIAGPILNFAGMIIVYYSLKEQFKANQIQAKQIRAEIIQGRNERYFDLSFKLVEKLADSVEKREGLLDEIPALNKKVDSQEEFVTENYGKSFNRAGKAVLIKYWWALNDLNEYFILISNQLNSNELNGEQKLILANLVDVTYGRRLKDARVGYQEEYLNGFERNSKGKDIRPEMLRHIDDRLVEIYRLQEDAKSQAATERIPFGDTELV